VEITMIKALQEQRAATWEQMKALNEKATTEARKFDGEEERQWAELSKELDAKDARVKELTDLHQRNLDVEASFRKLNDTPAIPGTAENRGRGSVAEEFRKFAAGRLQDQHGMQAKGYEVKSDGIVDFRALSKLTAAAGANTVKTTFYDRLMAHLIEVSAILRAGPTILNTTSGEPMQIPITTAHSTGALVAEAATIPTSEPTFGQRALGAYKYGALIQVSNELLTDTSVDLEGYLSMQAGRAVGNSLGTHLITGTGSSQPSGIVTTATTGVTGSASVAGAFTADNLIDLFYSVISPYRDSPNAAWLVRDATMASIRKFKDSTGQYLFQPSLVLGTPDTLIGKPIYTDPNVAAVALSAASVVFGDISQYVVRLVNGVRFERSDDFAFNTDLVTFRVLVRGDGILADQTGSVKKFVGNAA
jgi:HK97 family phage major capsid protein